MEKLYAYTMVSRNKDNKGVFGFKQRTKSYLCYPGDGSLQGFEVDIETVCRCTGITDMNNNLIYLR